MFTDIDKLEQLIFCDLRILAFSKTEKSDIEKEILMKVLKDIETIRKEKRENEQV